MIGGLHAAALLGGEEWIVAKIDLAVGIAERHGTQLAKCAIRGEEIDRAGRRVGRQARPEVVGILAGDGDHFADGIVVAGPAGDGKQRRSDARRDGQALQFGEVVRTRAVACFAIFVFELYTEDRTPVLPEEALDLAAYLAVEAAHVLQILGVVAAQRNVLFDEPVRKAAIAHFAVIPGTDAQVDVESAFVAQLDKMAEIALAGPVELAFDLFVMNPENVGGHNLDAAGLHLEQFLAPILFRIAREVEFAHHWQPGLSIEREVAAVDSNSVPRGRDAAHVQKAGFRRRRGNGSVNGKGRRNLLGREDGGQTQKSGNSDGGKPSLHINHSPELDRRFQWPRLARRWNRFHSSGRSMPIRRSFKFCSGPRQFHRINRLARERVALSRLTIGVS